MKIGDYVAKITNEWEKHNNWMEFPDEKPEPLGMIVARSRHGASTLINFWDVLMSCGGVESFNENYLKVIDESR